MQGFVKKKKKKELEKCTFKPKINYYHNNDTNIVRMTTNSNNSNNNEDRIEQMYKRGLYNIANKKDKTKDEVDLERFGKECTFKPKIENKDLNPNQIARSYQETNINNVKQIEKFNERLKQGRIDREIKENALRRFEITSPERVNSEINRNYNYNSCNSNNIQYENLNPQENRVKSPIKHHNLLRNVQGPTSKILTRDVEDRMREYLNTHDPNNKDAVPLLIIDVNIRPGVKKQIYVFEGNTPEELAENFAREHNLSMDVKDKLKILVENNLSKLLMKIEEENSSISTSKTNKI